MRQIILNLCLILPGTLGLAASAAPSLSTLPSVVVHFVVRPETPGGTELGKISTTVDARDRFRRLVRLANEFGEHYLAAYRLLHPNVLEIVPLGAGMFNIVFDTLTESERVYESFPRECAALLADSPFEISVMRNELSGFGID